MTTIAKIDEFLHIRAFRLSLQYSFLTQYNRIMNCRREANNTLSIGLSRWQKVGTFSNYKFPSKNIEWLLITNYYYIFIRHVQKNLKDLLVSSAYNRGIPKTIFLCCCVQCMWPQLLLSSRGLERLSFVFSPQFDADNSFYFTKNCLIRNSFPSLIFSNYLGFLIDFLKKNRLTTPTRVREYVILVWYVSFGPFINFSIYPLR